MEIRTNFNIFFQSFSVCFFLSQRSDGLGVRCCVVGSGCGTQLYKSYMTNTAKWHFSEIHPSQTGFRENLENYLDVTYSLN